MKFEENKISYKHSKVNGNWECIAGCGVEYE